MKKVILIWRMQWKDKDYIKSSNSVHFANSIHSTKKLLTVLSIKTIYMLIQKVINKRRKTKGGETYQNMEKITSITCTY